MAMPMDPTLLPTQDEIAFYRTHGYYITRPIFTDTELDQAIEASERFYAGLDQQEIRLPDGKTSKQSWWKEKGFDVLRKNDFSIHSVPELKALCRKPILGAIAALLVGEDVRLWHDQLLYKPPHDPQKPQNVGWHTDYGYWRTCTSNEMLTAWVPFTAMPEELGPISFIDGSHQWPPNNHLDFFSNDLDGLEKQFVTGGAEVKKVAAIMDRGQVSFHDCRTIHGSGPNLTDGPRRSIALHMQPASNQYRQAYRDDGTMARHENDYLTQDEAGRPNYANTTYCPVLGRYAEATSLLTK